MMVDIENIKNVYFIGIGGIGMSALAQLFLHKGSKVSGSDREASPVTEMLEKKGIKVVLEQKKENVPQDVNMVIYSAAVPEENPEIKQAREIGVPVVNYFEALGVVSKEKYTIAVAGTHGKTTTTAMIAEIFVKANQKPTVIVGSILKEQGSNFISGESDVFIVEACEHKRHFLHLHPDILVITNIEEDHLDYYGNLKNIEHAFRELTVKVPEDGFIVCDTNNVVVGSVVKDAKARVTDYSHVGVKELSPQTPGEYNKRNAQAALAVVEAFNATNRSASINQSTAQETLKTFKGTWRRFEFKGENGDGALVYDDYAHHPTEIKAMLKTAREKFSDKRIVAVFQPHLYSRTKFLLNDFAASFENADEVLIAPIYAAREPEDPNVNAEVLAGEIKKTGKNAKAFSDFSSIVKYLKQNIREDTVLFTIGAGDVFKVGEQFLHS